MKASVTLAGIRFTIPIEQDFHRDDFSDLDIDAVWLDADSARADETVKSVDLGAPGGLTVTIDTEHPRILLPMLPETEGAGYWQLRQVAPIVAAWHRRLTLHAAAVVVDDAATVIVGGSGVGKSTLTWALAKQGAYPASDDLAPVRFLDHLPVIHRRSVPVPLRLILFLSRADTSPVIEPLAPTEALAHHLANGFGEHGDPDIWAHQFDAYHRLVATTPHGSLVIPDARDEVDAAASWLIDQLRTPIDAG